MSDTDVVGSPPERIEPGQELADTLAWTAHQVKEPLCVTRFAIAHVLERQDFGQEERLILSRAQGILMRLANDLDDLLSWASSGGTKAVKLRPVNLSHLIRSAMDWCLAPAELQRVSLELNEHVQVRADPIYLREALVNIIRNAIDHSMEESEIRISLTGDQFEAILAVSSHGPIPEGPSNASSSGRIRNTRRMPERSGLGLLIADRVITAPGGRIGVETTRGETCFTIVLPNQSQMDPR